MQFFNREEVAQYLRGIQPGVPGWKGTTTAQALKDMGQALLYPGDVVTGYKEPTLEGATNMAVDIMPMSAVASMATKVPAGALGANVFHGGPHRWSPEPDFPHGRPRLDKMGTGEGHQAYGHGFYSADAPGVARQYKQDLSGFDELVLTTSKGKLRGEALDDVDLEVAKYLEFGEKDAGQFKHNTVYYAKKRAEKAGRPDVLKRLDEYGPDARKSYEKNVGTLYKLDLPDADIAKYLDWDKPLSEQPKSVREALVNMVSVSAADRKQITKEIKAVKARLNDPWVQRSGGTEMKNKLKEQLQELKAVLLDDSLTGEEFYAGAVAGLGGREAASEALRKAGIPGLKYFDQGSRADNVRVLPRRDPKTKRNIWLVNPGWKAPNQTKSFTSKSEAEKYADDFYRTRNYVTWDQDVLDRSKMLERDGQDLAKALMEVEP